MKNTFLKTIKNIVKILVVVGLIWLIIHVASEIHLFSDISKLFSPKAETPSQATSSSYNTALIGICVYKVMQRNESVQFVDESNKAGNYDESLKLLLVYIPAISKCNKRSSRPAEDYQYESTLYQKLAETLKLKGDLKRAELALAKSKQVKEPKTKSLAEEKKQQEEDLDRVLAK